MKNIFRFLMAVAVLFTASCAKEDISSSIGGGEVEVTFTANLPELGTRAYGDGTQVNTLRYFVYDGETLLSDLSGEQGIAVGVPTTVNLVLLKGMTYNIVFWADCGKVYNYDTASKSVTVDYATVNANDEKRDAFYKFVATFDPANSTSENTNIVLTRPFAQLNAKANDVDKIKLSGVTLSTSTVTLTAYSTLNIADGTVTGADVKTLKAADVLEDGLLSMNYLLAPADGYVSDVKFTINNSKDIDFGNKYYNVPLKRNYRTNILGALLTKSTDFTVSIDPVFGEPAEDLDAETQIFKVSTAEELAVALTTKVEKQIENLEIILLNDIDLPITSLGDITPGSGEYKVGNVGTDNITIDLNSNKLNITTTYWSALGAKNDNALFTIKNGTMTSSQATGTWNSYDLTFANCNYAIEDVVFEKAVAFANAGKNVDLKNITINETHDYYAMWITAEGQNVNIDGLIINSDGRGIKIDEQYVDAPAKVTLDIANASFTTTNKSAILVKSAAGAVINASNLNIVNVAEDKVYAVWVDEDAAAYYDLVKVTGAKVRLEGSAVVSTQQEFEAAVEAGKKQINLAAANFTIPTQFNTAGLTNGTTVTLIGAGEATVLSFNSVAGGADGGLNSYADGLNLVFKNMAVVSPNTGSAYTGGFGRALSATFTNCKYYGQYRAVNANTKFEKCTIDPQTSYIYTDYANVDFVDCTFNCSKGKAIQVYNDANSSNTTINVTNCIFTANEVGYTWDNKPVTAIDINSNGEVFTVNINNSTATGFGVGLQSGNSLHNIKGGANYITIYVDGVCVHEPAPVADAEGNYSVKSAAGLESALQDIENGKSIALAAGEYVIPSAAQNKTVTFVNNGNVEDVKVGVTKVGVGGENCDYGLDGSNATFENITITTNSSTYIGYARCNGTYKNCVINGTYTLYGNSVFEDCTFNVSGDVYNIWTWGAPTATFTRCTFNCDGKAVLLYGQANTELTVNGCTFNDKGGLTDLKAAIEIGNDYGTSYNLIVNNATVNGFEINYKGIITGTTLWANKNSMGQDKLNVVVDGVDVY